MTDEMIQTPPLCIEAEGETIQTKQQPDDVVDKVRYELEKASCVIEQENAELCELAVTVDEAMDIITPYLKASLPKPALVATREIVEKVVAAILPLIIDAQPIGNYEEKIIAIAALRAMGYTLTEM